MNLKQLIAKMDAIEEGADASVEECGSPMPIAIGGPAGLQKQQDNVTMNVSMNGSGPGGIKDLMNILRNIEGSDHSASQGHEEPIMGEPGESVTGNDSPLSITDEVYDDEEKFANAAPGGSPKHTHGIDAVTFSGDDMNSKAKVSPLARAPGTNTLREPVQEGLVERLSSLYNEIKTRDLTENVLTDHSKNTLQHIIKTHQRDVKDFIHGGEMSEHLFDALYDYYFDDMPYGIKKARTGDPHEWISDRFHQDAGGIGEQAGDVGMMEDRTEEKDAKGNVVKWKEETPWRKAQNKDGRGKVTNMSDKARRESEKMSKKEKDVEEGTADVVAPMVKKAGQAVGQGVQNAQYNLTHPGEMVGALAHDAGQAVGNVVHGVQQGYDAVKQGVQNVANQAVQGYQQGAHPDVDTQLPAVGVAGGETNTAPSISVQGPATNQPTTAATGGINKTNPAVSAFQKSKGLPVDSTNGPMTKAAAAQMRENFELEEMLKIAGLR